MFHRRTFLCKSLSALFPVRLAYSLEPVATPNRLLSDSRYPFVPAAAARMGHLVALDTYNHRIVLLNEHTLAESRQISQIGQDDGGLFTPFDFTLTPDNQFVVLDSHGTRLQWFSWNGKWQRTVHLDGVASSLTSSASGKIILSLPQSRHHIVVFDEKGKKIQQLGAPHRLSDFYGDNLIKENPTYGLFINRSKLVTDEDDNIYVAFEAAPYVEKYDKSGNLLYSRQIAGDVPSRIISEFRNKKRSPIKHGYHGDGVSLPYIVSGMTADPRNRSFYVFLLWDRCWIYVLNSAGETQSSWSVPDPHLLFQKPFFDIDNRRVITAVLSSKLGSSIYALPILSEGDIQKERR